MCLKERVIPLRDEREEFWKNQAEKVMIKVSNDDEEGGKC